MYGSCSVKEMDIFFVHRKIKWHEKEKNDKEITKIIVVWCLFITAYTYPIIYLTPTFYYGERSFSLHGPKFFNLSQNYVTILFSTFLEIYELPKWNNLLIIKRFIFLTEEISIFVNLNNHVMSVLNCTDFRLHISHILVQLINFDK